jgi:cathepsin X
MKINSIIHYINFIIANTYKSELKTSLYEVYQSEEIDTDINYLFKYFNWCDLNLCVKSKNQHIPHYCGACWAFGTISALEDRLKIFRNGKSPDISLSIQHILNCINIEEASCNGGNLNSVYEWLLYNKISYETSMPYLSCSIDSDINFCKSIKEELKCNELNIARTCIDSSETSISNSKNNDICVGLYHYPNLTIEKYYYIHGITKMKYEIYTNGPIACEIDASLLISYTTGILTGDGFEANHVIEVVGWGETYWIIRNSWGEYWGEFGFARIKFNSLGLNNYNCIAAKIKTFTSPENNNQFHCYENGVNCNYVNKFI